MGRKSDWLPPDQKPCPKCHGSGDSGQRTAKGETIACSACGGFGY